jgi:hypothetical protein
MIYQDLPFWGVRWGFNQFNSKNTLLFCSFLALCLCRRCFSSVWKIKVLKTVVSKKPRKNSTGIISVWTGLEGKKPNRTEINQFELVFDSVQKLLKKFSLIVHFDPKQDRTENVQPYVWWWQNDGLAWATFFSSHTFFSLTFP